MKARLGKSIGSLGFSVSLYCVSLLHPIKKEIMGGVTVLKTD